MSFWTDIDPTNPHSRYFHPVQERRYRRNKEVAQDLGDPGVALLRGKQAGDPGFETAVLQAKRAVQRRQPMDPNAPQDLAAELLLQARRRQIGALQIGATRASTFASVAQPLSPVTSLFGA